MGNAQLKNGLNANRSYLTRERTKRSATLPRQANGVLQRAGTASAGACGPTSLRTASGAACDPCYPARPQPLPLTIHATLRDRKRYCMRSVQFVRSQPVCVRSVRTANDRKSAWLRSDALSDCNCICLRSVGPCLGPQPYTLAMRAPERP